MRASLVSSNRRLDRTVQHVFQRRTGFLFLSLTSLRRPSAKTLSIIVLAVVGIIYFGGAGLNHNSIPDRPVSGQPLLIPQGPMGVTSATSSDPYWFQEGAIGDSSIQKSFGVTLLVAPVYCTLNTG